MSKTSVRSFAAVSSDWKAPAAFVALARELEGASSWDDVAALHFLRRLLPDFYFVNTPLSRMRAHLSALAALHEGPLYIDLKRPPGARFSELTLCAFDDEQPGLLAKVAGVLVALRINVHTAWIHTLKLAPLPGGEPGSRIVLDTLILSETHFGRTRPLSARSEKAVIDSLAEVLSGEAEVDVLLTRRFRRSVPPLSWFEISATDAGDTALFKLRAADDPGVLYRVTRALKRLDLHIEHAQINTSDRAADDVFFVTSASGASLSTEATRQVLRELRLLLAETN